MLPKSIDKEKKTAEMFIFRVVCVTKLEFQKFYNIFWQNIPILLYYGLFGALGHAFLQFQITLLFFEHSIYSKLI